MTGAVLMIAVVFVFGACGPVAADEPVSEVSKVAGQGYLPDGWKFGHISAVTTNAQGDVYIFHRGSKADPVVVFDKIGKYLRSWGRDFFGNPHGSAVLDRKIGPRCDVMAGRAQMSAAAVSGSCIDSVRQQAEKLLAPHTSRCFGGSPLTLFELVEGCRQLRGQPL